jgi:methanogenic corrinoid protein MtbC1
MNLQWLPPPSAIADALLVGNTGPVLDAAYRYMEHGGAPFLVDALARPVMAVVGDRWCAGHVTVAEEHAATELLRELLAHLLPAVAWHQGGPRAVIACAPGERHALGARLVSQVLALDGWHVRFLGADTPATALARFVERERPLLVGLSVTLPDNVPGARSALELLHRTTPGIPLLVGGRGTASLAPEGAGAWTVVRTTTDLLSLTRGGTGVLVHP